MSVLSILFKRRRAVVAGVTVDATLNERHLHEASVTDHPIEDGSNVADHVIQRPDRLTIGGILTDTPVDYTDLATAVFAGGASRSLGAYAALRRAKEAGLQVSVVTALRSYDKMVIERLSVPKAAGGEGGIRFSVELKTVNVVESEVVSIPESIVDEDHADQGQSERDLGRQATEDAPTDVSDPASVAYGLVFG